MESFLQIDGLCKSFGDRIIFDNLSLNINQGEKVGLIARNLSGTDSSFPQGFFSVERLLSRGR